jgi:hypothetical protein
VTGLDLNRVPDSVFQPRLAPGTLLKESESDQHWRIGPRGEWVAYQPPGRGDSGRMPIGWLFMVSLTSLLIAAMGVILRWRRRPAY